MIDIDSDKCFKSRLSGDKLRWTPSSNIPIKRLLSFLTVDITATTGHLGWSNGWTRYIGDNGLVITGGKIGGVAYLYSIQYGKRLQNGYNNYVNPFYLWEILTDEGKKFFLDFYKEEIDNSLAKIEGNYRKAKACKDEAVSFLEKYSEGL